MWDNVLTATKWLLKEQAREAAAKRRIGLGFMGLGDALAMRRLVSNRKEHLCKIVHTLYFFRTLERI